ncbi:ABC transporter permease subunit [Paenibacillus sp. HN-1]|uniref:ABC transporter permease subunit n=1 Tax=Paenibacillus TaxID=44249 RepID=UPI001CA9DB5D|nr:MULTISPECIES: ABC transporter permease subunit [Paenibacillus]MBY9077682.1 ABC transporter permease subunit [Paenibacillus sp. CGMCC 1.18879]MBY9083739.1 ABC transporter permease subunit [Paenibacillus sinensis]
MNIIWKMTWKELLRKRVLTLTLILTAVFLITFWFIASSIGRDFGAGLPADDPGRLIERYGGGLFVLGLGFFFGTFVVAFLSIFSSSSSVSGEAEIGVMQALLPRPLPRWKWYLGRWLGYVSFCMLYALLLFASILLISSFHVAVPRDPQSLLLAYLLYALLVPLLVSVSMLGSTFLSSIGNGVLMTMLYGAGWLGGMIEKVSSQFASLKEGAFATLNQISGLLMLVMPTDGVQRMMLDRLFNLSDIQEMAGFGMDSMLSVFGVGNAPSPAFLAYTLIYTGVMLGLGLWRFQSKDL